MMNLLRKARSARVTERGPATRVRPARDVLSAGEGGIVVLLDLQREVYLGLDEVGTVIWQEVEDGSDRMAIVERLRCEFDAPDDVLRADADRFLEELETRGLVVPA
jgi:hypothetical protein